VAPLNEHFSRLALGVVSSNFL